MYKILGTLAHLIGAYFVIKTFYELGENTTMSYIYASIGFLFEVIKNHSASEFFAGKIKGIFKNIFTFLLVAILISLSLFCSLATLGGASQAGDIAHNKATTSKDSIEIKKASMVDLKLAIEFNKTEIENLQNKIDVKEASKNDLGKMSKKAKALAIEKIDKAIAGYNYSISSQRRELNATMAKLEALQTEIEALLPATMLVGNDFFDNLASVLKISREDAKRIIKMLIAIMLEISSIYLLTLAKLSDITSKKQNETKRAKYAYYRKNFKLARFAGFGDFLANAKCLRSLKKLLL